MKNKENDMMDFTQGSILKKLLRFMVPILGALILQAAYGAVDLLVVGRFGSTSGLSGVSTGSQVLNLVTFVVTQLAMGITVLIARYLGEKKEEQIGSIIGGGTVVFAAISLVLFVVMVGFARPIAVLMQAPEEAVGLTAAYIRICGAGIFLLWHITYCPRSFEDWVTAIHRCCLSSWHALSISWVIWYWWQDWAWMPWERHWLLFCPGIERSVCNCTPCEKGTALYHYRIRFSLESPVR